MAPSAGTVAGPAARLRFACVPEAGLRAAPRRAGRDPLDMAVEDRQVMGPALARAAAERRWPRPALRWGGRQG